MEVLTERARLGTWSQNSLTRSLKASYPLNFDIAVAVAGDLRTRLDIAIPDGEIAFIAMQLGAFLERDTWGERRLTAIVLCSGYPETRELLRTSIERNVGNVLDIVDVRSSTSESWPDTEIDIVLTTSDAAASGVPTVRVQLFLTAIDVDRINVAVSRIRRTQRLARLHDELEQYFLPSAFVSDVTGQSPEQVIGTLGGLFVGEGVVGGDFVRRAIERERLSTTAFIISVAIPHAIGTGASRTSIAVGIADPSVEWGDARVQIVLLVAFAQSDRAAFQLVFEQLVEVFSGRDSIALIAQRSTSFPQFLDELVVLIDG